MDFVDLIWAYVLVFLLAAAPFAEAYIVIPIAILGGLSAIPVFVIGLLGNYATVLLVILFVDRIRNWRNKKNRGGSGSAKRTQRAQALWNKFGFPGLALIGPLVVGSHLTTLMGVILGGTKKQAAIWMAISLLVWCVAFTVLGHLGVDFFKINNPFIERWFAN